MLGSGVIAEASRLGLAIIFNSIWQGALIAAVAWVTLRVFSRANATTRYAVWCLALLAILIVPVVTSLSRVSIEPTTQSASHATSFSATTAVAHRTVRETPRTSHWTSGSASTQPVAEPRGFVMPNPLAFHVEVPSLASAIVFSVWILGALAILARLAVGLWQLERLKHDSLPLDVAYRDAMPQWAAALKGERDVRICVSEAIEVPVAVGLFDSMILLPAHLVHSLDPNEIDQISLHELGHLLRADDWTNAMQRIVAGLLFFNPAAWLVSRQMDVEREVACDDYVLQLTGAVRPYAFCLTKMAEMTAWPHRPVPAPGVFVTRKNISIRIERLLRTGRAIGSSIAPTTAGVVTAALIAVFLLLRTMTPSIAFTVPEPAPVASPALVMSPAPIISAAALASAAPAAPVVRTVRVTAAPPAATPEIKSALPAKAYDTQAKVYTDVAQKLAEAEKKIADVQVPPIPPIHVDVKVASDGGCTGCDFNNANLSGRDFSGRTLEGSNFRGANLRNAHFEHANLTGTDFAGADLRGASFAGANLEGCDLRDARVDGTNFDGANLTGCDFHASALSPEQARQFLSSCHGCDFQGVSLRGQNLHGINVEGLDMRGADLRGADLTNASFVGVDFSHADLSGARVDGASFEGCDFSHANLRSVDMSKANLTGADMGSAEW